MLVHDQEIQKHGGSWVVVGSVWIALVVSGLLHSITYYQLMGTVGAVATGILQSLRAVRYAMVEGNMFQCLLDKCWSVL